MKNSLKTTFLFCFVIICFHGFATHNRSGDITYKRIAPFTGPNGVAVYNYSITVTKYFDANVNMMIADRCADTVYFGDGTKGTAYRINGLTTGCSCSAISVTPVGCGGNISSDPVYWVKKSVFTITHAYAGPGTYIMYTNDPNRNAGVHNIPNSDQQMFHLEAMLVIAGFSAFNSSPVFNLPPVGQASFNACYYFSHAATDADSLVYELIPCMGANGPVPGYFDPETGVNGNFSINSGTGLLTWCTPQFVDVYNIALRVREYRANPSGVLVNIGYITRDIQIIVKIGVVGLAENNPDRIVGVFPNPFSGKLTIQTEGITGFTRAILYSIGGKQVLEQKLKPENSELEISTNQLPAGVYNLELKTGTSTVYRKVIKN